MWSLAVAGGRSHRHGRGGYEPVLAHSRARERGARPGRARLSVDSELRREVQDKLLQDKLLQEWSPEQIAAHLPNIT